MHHWAHRRGEFPCGSQAQGYCIHGQGGGRCGSGAPQGPGSGTGRGGHVPRAVQGMGCGVQAPGRREPSCRTAWAPTGLASGPAAAPEGRPGVHGDSGRPEVSRREHRCVPGHVLESGGVCLGPAPAPPRGGALSPGPPASCSLCSRAASSPTGLRGARPSSCSYSTHRLLSVSLAAGDPAGAQTSPAEPTGAREAGGEGAGQAPSGTQPRPAVSPGHTYPWVSASGWGRARPDSWPSWWRGAQATRPPRQQRLPHPNLGQQAGGRAQASGQSQGGWVLHRPFPAGRRAQGAASWARRTHSVLSHAEELGHVADDRAEAVVHPDVGAHPGGQLGPGVHVGEPGGRRLSARGPTPPSPQPQLPLAERRTSTRLAPARLSTRVSVSRGEPHLWSQRKMAP